MRSVPKGCLCLSLCINWLQVLEFKIIKFDVIFTSSMKKLTDVAIFSKTRLKIEEIG